MAEVNELVCEVGVVSSMEESVPEDAVGDCLREIINQSKIMLEMLADDQRQGAVGAALTEMINQTQSMLDTFHSDHDFSDGLSDLEVHAAWTSAPEQTATDAQVAPSSLTEIHRTRTAA